jgi:hypothetical protein
MNFDLSAGSQSSPSVPGRPTAVGVARPFLQLPFLQLMVTW